METDFLYARPSFLSGAGRALDLWGAFEEFNDSPTAEDADAEALYSDWRMVGQNLESAAEALAEKIVVEERK